MKMSDHVSGDAQDGQPATVTPLREPAAPREREGAPPRSHAVVLGGGIAGLLAARVLRDHFDRVTLVERDDLETGGGPRRGVPQGRHAHGLLAGGAQVLWRLFPGLREELVADGALLHDLIRNSRFYGLGGYQLRYESGLEGVFLTRPMLEGHLRRRLLALPGIAPLPGYRAESLIAVDGGRGGSAPAESSSAAGRAPRGAGGAGGGRHRAWLARPPPGWRPWGTPGRPRRRSPSASATPPAATGAGRPIWTGTAWPSPTPSRPAGCAPASPSPSRATRGSSPSPAG